MYGSSHLSMLDRKIRAVGLDRDGRIDDNTKILLSRSTALAPVRPRGLPFLPGEPLRLPNSAGSNPKRCLGSFSEDHHSDPTVSVPYYSLLTAWGE